jgi:UDP-glucose 4-epimerase
MKILVIGGSGFIGLSLISQLLKEHYTVTVFDLAKPKIQNKKIKFIKGNINNSKLLEKIIKKNEIVYHLAGISDIGEAATIPIETVNINILATVKILEICSKFKIKRFIFASTVYVHSSQGGFYRTSKKSSELYIQEYWEQNRLNSTILRYGTIYGPSNNLKNNINKITNYALKKNIVKYEGSNLAKRNIIHVTDVGKISVKILQKKYENKAVLITGKKNIKIKNIMKIVQKQLNIKKPLFFKNKKLIGHYISNPFTYKKPKEFKLTPNKEIKIRDGISQVIKYLRNI